MTGNTVADVGRIGLLDALAAGPERWDRLITASQAGSPFMSWAWHHAWAESAAPEEVAASFALQLRGGGPGERVEAVLPLTLCPLRFRRTPVMALTWATRGVGSPDHLDIPALPGAPLESAIPLMEVLPWDVIILSGVAQDATNLARLADAFVRHGFTVSRTPFDSCPYIDLPDSWNAYLASLSRSRRQTIRRRERKLRREHDVAITDYAPGALDEGWNQLRTLHEQRWAGAGTLGDPQIASLLRRFASVLAERDELWLTTLDLDGEPAAAWCGFAWGDTVYFYQSGRAPKWNTESVGQVLMGVMIRRGIERGYRRFDFLRGRDAYKFSWTSTERTLYEIVVFRPGWRGARLRGLDMAGRMRAQLRHWPAL